MREWDHVKAYVHRGMVVFSERDYCEESLRALHYCLNIAVLRQRRDFPSESLESAKRTVQIDHAWAVTSKREALRIISDAFKIMQRDYPELERYLVVDWRQDRRSVGNVIDVGFWLDVPTLEQKRAQRRAIKWAIKEVMRAEGR